MDNGVLIDWERWGLLNGTPTERKDGLIRKLNELQSIISKMQEVDRLTSFLIPFIIRLYNSTTVEFDTQTVISKFENRWNSKAVDELYGFNDVDVEFVLLGEIVEEIKNELEEN
jgi:hypothetical protein